MCSPWEKQVIEYEKNVKLEHLLYEVLTETTSVQPIIFSNPCSFSMLYLQGINHNRLE